MGRKAIDMTGWVMKEHGVPDSRLTVLHRVDDYIDKNNVHYPRWECQCECGQYLQVRATNIRTGNVKSCGCLLAEMAHDRTFIDLTGQKFGKLTVLYRAEDYVEPSGEHKTMWHCICECGNETNVRRTNLTSGSTKSCGCLAKEGAHPNKQLRQYDNDGNLIGRICSCCKRMLSIDNYYKNSKVSDGISDTCKYCQAYSLTARYYTYKKGAETRNLNFELTRDEFHSITKQPCYYCGEYNNDYLGEKYSGVDRIDSSIGYIPNNVVPCCTVCNRMKLDYTLSDWLSQMYKILNHLKYTEEVHESNRAN